MDIIRADLLYDQLKGRKHLTGLQTRLIYLIHARRMRLDLLRVQIIAAAGTTEHTQKLLISLSDQYADLLFPGVDQTKDADSFEERAKELLAQEMKKIYRIKRIENQEARKKELDRIVGAGGAGGAVAAKATLEEQQAAAQIRRQYSRKKE